MDEEKLNNDAVYGAGLGDRVRTRMAELGLTQSATAKAARLPLDYVRDVLRGRVKEPSAYKLSRLGDALECSMGYLMGYTPDPGSPPNIDATIKERRSEASGKRVEVPVSGSLAADVFRAGQETLPWTSLNIYLEDWQLRQEHLLYRLMDDHFNVVIPRGYWVHAIKWDNFTPDLLEDDDVVIVERYRDEGTLVERTVRLVSTVRPLGRVYLHMQSHNSRWHERLEPLVDTERDGVDSYTVIAKVFQAFTYLGRGFDVGG